MKRIEVPVKPTKTVQMTNYRYRKSLKTVQDAHRQGDWNFDDKIFCRDDWKVEVVSGDTQLGYYDWVVHKYDAAYESGF